MFMRTLRHGIAAVAAAVAVTGVFTAPASAAEPGPAQQCRLTADLFFFSTDLTRRANGVGSVTCAGSVYEITVAVVLTQENVVVARGRNVCQAQAGCRVVASAENPAGLQAWCAQATGTVQVSPLGPIADLGSQRLCGRN